MKKHKTITDLWGNQMVSDTQDSPNFLWATEPQDLSPLTYGK